MAEDLKDATPRASQKFGIKDGRPFNHYTCETCNRVSTTKHREDGVTPFMIQCLAGAAHGCKGVAMSAFYRGPQWEDQIVHGLWVRPTPEQLDAALLLYKVAAREECRRHYDNGGCFLWTPAGDKPVYRESWA